MHDDAGRHGYARGPLSKPVLTFSAMLSSSFLSCFDGTGFFGTYTLSRLDVADEAGSVLRISDAAKLGALFPSGTTVTVTN